MSGLLGSASWLIGIACTPPADHLQQAPSRDDRPSDESSSLLDDRVATIAIRIRSSATTPHATETMGLLGLLFERAMADLPGVVPKVGEAPVSPGLARWNDPEAVAWRLAVVDRGGRDTVELEALLCIEPSPCVTTTATGARSRIESLVDAMTSSIAKRLHRKPPPEARQAWRAPISADDYAVLMAGRSAAVLYGFQTVAPENFENRHRDPPLRAVFLDPSMQLAQWVLGRVRFGRGDLAGAETALSAATSLLPSSVVAQADLARVLTDRGRRTQAATAWDEILRRSPNDPRLRIARIEFAVSMGQPNQAATLLATLPDRYKDSAKVAELEVEVARALGRRKEEDQWLAVWQALAPQDPEPVEQRIRHAIRRRAYPEAVELSMELAKRGREKTALDLRLAAALGAQDYILAENAAQALGDAVLAERIRARLELETRTSTKSRVLRMAKDAEALLVRGEVRLAEGKSYGALMDAEHALALNPWLPEALSLKARAHAARGEIEEARATRARLRLVDPGYEEGGPITAPGSTGVGTQSQVVSP